MARRTEGYFKRAVPVIDKDKCNNCGLCAKVCDGQPLMMVDGKVVIDPNPALGCLACGGCMMICPTGAVGVSGRNLSNQDLLELPPKEARATIDQLEALLLRRRAIRHFKPVEVERSVVERIIQTASTAPMGLPPTEVGIVVFHGREKVREFSDDVMKTIERMMKMFNKATLVLYRPFMKKPVVESLKEFVIPLVRAMTEERAKGADPLLYSAPVAMLFHNSPFAEPADSYIAATYAMIAAESLGLGTCMIGLVKPFMERDARLMKKYGIPKGNVLQIVLIMGYPDVTFKKGVRRRFSSVAYHGD